MKKGKVVKQGMDTPWGQADHIERLSEGVWNVSTPSHGGIYLSPERNELIPVELQEATFRRLGLSGWYEEDLDWTIPAYLFPDWFPEDTCKKSNHEFAQEMYPKHFGEVLAAGRFGAIEKVSA